MNNFLNRIVRWFKPQPAQKKPTFLNPQLSPNKPKLSPEIKPSFKAKHFNSRHYRQLIGKLASRGIAIQRARMRRNDD